jgi:acyl dehydratase
MDQVSCPWTTWSVGDPIKAVSLAMTLQRLVVAAGGERDMNPLHFDSDYARSCGFRAAFANGLFQQAVCDRAVTDFTGPTGELRRLKLAMKAPVYVGSTLSVTGAIRSLAEAGGYGSVGIELELATEDGLCSTATATARVPVHGLCASRHARTREEFTHAIRLD